MAKKYIAAIGTVLLLSACATSVDRTTQLITVATPGVTGVECDLRTAKHRYSVITPNTVRVEKSRHDMTVTCYKSNYMTAVATLGPRISGTTTGNVATGILPGFLVDWHTGAMYKYPEQINIEMRPMGALIPEDPDLKAYREPVFPQQKQIPATADEVDQEIITIIDESTGAAVPQEEILMMQEDAPAVPESPQFDLNAEQSAVPAATVADDNQPIILQHMEQQEDTAPAVPEKPGQDITLDDLNPKAGGDTQGAAPIPLLKRVNP